jgi:hypothetical protein
MLGINQQRAPARALGDEAAVEAFHDPDHSSHPPRSAK